MVAVLSSGVVRARTADTKDVSSPQIAAVVRPEYSLSDLLIGTYVGTFGWLDDVAARRMATQWRGRGWNNAAVNTSVHLAEWTIEHGHGLLEAVGPVRHRKRFFDVWLRVATSWADLTVGTEPSRPGHGLPRDLAWAWAQTLVGVPTERDYHVLRTLIGTVGSGIPSEDMTAWTSVGPCGPLAYAAGLTIPEAQALLDADADAPPVEELMTLAVLRGWQFPPPDSPESS